MNDKLGIPPKRLSGTAGVPPATSAAGANPQSQPGKTFLRFALIAGGTPAVPDNHYLAFGG
ncbi:MAG TPA: hypothetical protein VGO56_06095 [Pyrinomonadaceae bacterium]|nr:hypothetical protein [Pyrinomonadaceae bacterium]